MRREAIYLWTFLDPEFSDRAHFVFSRAGIVFLFSVNALV